jgi:hypothetical protein
MKTKTRILVILLALMMSSCAFTRQASVQQPYFSQQVFYDQLSPYGQWVDYQNYGYAWIPNAGPDFVPYSSGGNWIMTEYGWTWASDYDWGWAPFHYGRWDYDNYYGWLWIPDNEWGPAWVTWRRAEGYYGWAPMGPGVNISMSFGNDYNNYNNHWIFVNDRYFGRNDIYRYYANQNDYDRIFRNSNVINNTYVDNRYQTTYVSGPDRAEVQRVTGRRVSSYAFQENNMPGQDLRNGQYRTYRPQIMKTNDNEQRPSPSRVTNLQDVRRPSERNSYNLQNGNRGRAQQQNAVNRQNAGNRQNNADRQDAVDQRNVRNNERAVQHQNAKKTRKSEQPKKSNSEADIRDRF